jgi:hypothetical protein
MIAGKHPLDPVTEARLLGAAAALDTPMPSLDAEVAGLPEQLGELVARCLAKRKDDRYPSALALLSDLEELIPGRARKNLDGDDSPYPGLTAFQEADAHRFFGRSRDVSGVVARLREQPLVGLVGPSGVGKSSLVRAGVVPALKSSGESWEALIVRPGRHPLIALAQAIEALRESRDSDPVMTGDDLVARLRAEPGTLGARLRARARRMRSQILLFVDQHEELYTLVADPAERRAFTACLTAAGDDPSGPLRVVIAMRSDFLDRAAEDARFVGELARGLVFLQPPDRAGLEEALIQPLDMLGYRFEAEVVPAMLDTLEATSGSLPLLQFTAAKLWEHRDRQRQVLTRASYQAMGGVAGALATHADEVLAGLPPPDQALVRALFHRLVTPERTRAIVDAGDLHDLGADRIIGLLVAARLLVVQNRAHDQGATVEIVHESLIKSWPTLQRWLDENQEDAAYLAQLHTAAKQWDAKGRPQGLLWRGEAMQEARLWRGRYTGELPPREADFLAAVIALGTRAARIKRRLVIGAFVFLLALVGAAGAALVSIRQAERTALENAEKAHSEAARAQTEAANAQTQAAAARLAEQGQREEAERAREAEAKLAAELKASRDKDTKLAVQTRQISAKDAQVMAAQKAAEAAKLAAKKKGIGKISTDLK